MSLLTRRAAASAVDLCALMAEAPDRYERAARLVPTARQRREELTLDQAQLAIACLRELGAGDTERLADVLRGAGRRPAGSSGHWR